MNEHKGTNDIVLHSPSWSSFYALTLQIRIICLDAFLVIHSQLLFRQWH